MPKPHERTRSRKHVNRSSPGGGGRIKYKLEAGAQAHCRLCGKPLGGIKHLSPVNTSKLNKSRRRVWRPYGGQLCHNCLKTSLRQAARVT